MKLYHYTDDDGVAGIRADGFAGSQVPDSRGREWLSADPALGPIARGRDWVVVVEIPDDLAEQHRHRFEDGEPYLDNYLVPIEVLNAHRPFDYRRITPS